MIVAYRVLYVRSLRDVGHDVPKTVRRADYDEVATLEAGGLDDVFEKMNVVRGDELPVRL